MNLEKFLCNIWRETESIMKNVEWAHIALYAVIKAAFLCVFDLSECCLKTVTYGALNASVSGWGPSTKQNGAVIGKESMFCLSSHQSFYGYQNNRNIIWAKLKSRDEHLMSPNRNQKFKVRALRITGNCYYWKVMTACTWIHFHSFW